MANDILKNDSNLMLEYHRQLLLKLIRIKGPISRVALTKITKLSPTTVGRIVQTLIEEEIVIEVGTSESGLGRKAVLLDINSTGRYAIGIDIDIYQVSAGISDLNGQIIYSKTASLPEQLTPETVADEISTMIYELYEAAEQEIVDKILGIGISLPGNVQWPNGIIKISPQLNWRNVALRDMIQEKYKGTIYIDNNVKATAAAEILFGYGKKFSDFVIVHVGSGIGAAVVANSDICRGVNGMYGEIGHMTIYPLGRVCDCGLRGCLQTHACMSALEKEAGIPFSSIIEKANEGDSVCISLLNDATDHIAMLISNVVNMYDPELVLITGEMFDDMEGLLFDVKNRIKPFLWGLENSPTIETSKFGHKDNIILSAASIVFQQFFLPPITIG